MELWIFYSTILLFMNGTIRYRGTANTYLIKQSGYTNRTFFSCHIHLREIVIGIFRYALRFSLKFTFELENTMCCHHLKGFL